MFEREHHRNVALVLEALDPQVLARHHCWFGGGTAMALRHGEYRQSVDIDFRVSDKVGYRALREVLGGIAGLQPLVRPGLTLQLAREVRTDQYGIRTMVLAGNARIKFEIVLEARIELDTPAPGDRICGVATLTAVDLAAEKLLALADRWSDDAVYSRDLIDLAMHEMPAQDLRAACVKAEAAYGQSVRRSLASAVQALAHRPGRLAVCMRALGIHALSPAQLWRRIILVQRRLEQPGAPPSPQQTQA